MKTWSNIKFGEIMIYKVKAKIIGERIGEFYRKLADGTVAKTTARWRGDHRLHEEGRPDGTGRG
jgi:hypothetical protein